jgi:cytosine/uracil/thiamine/allantoin permease
MGGYTVFLGPITGIMITDVSFRSLQPRIETDGRFVAY